MKVARPGTRPGGELPTLCLEGSPRRPLVQLSQVPVNTFKDRFQFVAVLPRLEVA
jgi:hypothetical protein